MDASFGQVKMRGAVVKGDKEAVKASVRSTGAAPAPNADGAHPTPLTTGGSSAGGGSQARWIDVETRRALGQWNNDATVAAVSMVNHPTVALYRVQRHVHQRMPRVLDEVRAAKAQTVGLGELLVDAKLAKGVVTDVAACRWYAKAAESLKADVQRLRSTRQPQQEPSTAPAPS
jgi:hypothetical protein